MAELLRRVELEAERLWSDFPPVLHHPKKKLILERGRRVPTSTMIASRWAPSAPGLVGPAGAVESVLGPFSYPSGEDAWHVNFADTHLFAFYGGPMFAQDEIQVAEHPLLACVREHLEATNDPLFPPRTRDAHRPTPVTITNVERWCAIDATGIYGRLLASADDAVVARQVERVDGRSNILAIVAPQGAGRYTREDIHDVVLTATTGFEAAGRGARIHTGHWGTGAFGGNRVLMAAAQVLAARLAGVDLVYHSLSPDAERAFERGLRIADDVPSGRTLEDVVDLLDARGFIWGASDGN